MTAPGWRRAMLLINPITDNDASNNKMGSCAATLSTRRQRYSGQRQIRIPDVHNKPSSVYLKACASWSWTEPRIRPVQLPSGWCVHCSQSSLPPVEEHNTAHWLHDVRLLNCNQKNVDSVYRHSQKKWIYVYIYISKKSKARITNYKCPNNCRGKSIVSTNAVKETQWT